MVSTICYKFRELKKQKLKSNTYEHNNNDYFNNLQSWFAFLIQDLFFM